MKSRSSLGSVVPGLLWYVVTAMVISGAADADEHAASKATSKEAKSDQLQAPTHRQVRIIEPKVNGKSVRLYTIATTPEGQIVAGVANGSSTKEPGAVLLLDSDGETLTQWSLELTPTSIAVAPDGTIFAGGSGRIAELGADGTVVKVIDSPHVGSIEELKKKTAESIRRSRTQVSASVEKQIDLLNDRVKKIELKAEDDRTPLEDAQLKAFKIQLKTLGEMIGSEDEGGAVPDAHLSAAILRSMNITSMAASQEDVFLCAADPGQGGYSVWRISRDLDPKTSEVIMDGLRGCCGQMDIQCCNGQLLVSENTKFKIGIYDRHGRAQATFGSRDRTSRGGFGSCCNPMNSMGMKDGTILTAESSIGHIKRFDTQGNLVAYIGKARIGGGCKHCALGYDEANDLYYMMYQDKNAICVLANNELTPMSVAEKELQQSQIDFLAKAVGQWDMKGETKENSGGLLSLFSSGRTRAAQHPVTSLKIGADGTAKILAGMYKAYGDKATLELLPTTDADSDSNRIPFALAIDQVRFLEGTWTFEQEDSAKLAFQGMSAVTLHRDPTIEHCAGADCQNPECKDANCPQHAAPPTQSVANQVGESVQLASGEPLQVFEEVTAEEVAQYEAEMDAAMASANAIPTFQYKLLSKKDLGKQAEAKLNQLGEQGWEFCGHVGKKMMFKRMGEFTVAESAR